jgi:hypothetical protein
MGAPITSPKLKATDMPRANLSPLFPIALSPQRLAQALEINPRVVLAAIRANELPVHQLGTKRRVLVGDAVEWIREYWSVPHD